MAPIPKSVIKGYRFHKSKLLHRLRAEQALGKALPKSAVVHHADGTKSEFSPLVICQDAAYHALLHVRMRVLRAGGNPNTERICADCKRLVPILLMAKRKPTNDHLGFVASQCKACIRYRANQWYAKKKAERLGLLTPPVEVMAS